MTAQTRMVRPGLFVERSTVDGRPRLLGSRCLSTGTVFFPAEQMCPLHPCVDHLESVELSGRGTVVAATTVHRGMAGFPDRYVLAVVALEEGPFIMAQLELAEPSGAATGTAVQLVIGTVRKAPDGAAVIGPKFRPAADDPS